MRLINILLLIGFLCWIPSANASWYFNVTNNSGHEVRLRYNSKFGCQDWQGGANYIGSHSYLCDINDPDCTIVAKGKDDIIGGNCAVDNVDPGSLWLYIWAPDSGGAYSILFNDEGTCNVYLNAARRRGFPLRKKLRAMGPGKFSHRCIFEGQTGE